MKVTQKYESPSFYSYYSGGCFPIFDSHKGKISIDTHLRPLFIAG